MKNKKMVTSFNKADLLKFANGSLGKEKVTMDDVHIFIGRGASTTMETVHEGRTLKYGDCIHHTTKTKFPIVQRFRHLFGAPIIIESKIYTADECNVIADSAKGFHNKLIKRRSKNPQGWEEKSL